MSDPLVDRLREAADDLVAGERVPPPHAVRARVDSRRPKWAVRALLPALAAAAAMVVAVGAQQIADGRDGRSRVLIPPPPVLGQLAPPAPVARALGAPGGHREGPPVEQAELLAVAPRESHGALLRTVGVERPRPKPDAEGRPLVDRCVHTYSDPGGVVLAGGCQHARPAASAPVEQVSVRMHGRPGQTFVTGTSSPNTAAVVLRARGQDDLVVATAVASPEWQEQVFYTAWWPRVETTITALARDGSELSTTVLPSGNPERKSEGDPELGTLLVNPAADGVHLADDRGAPPREDPLRTDVLARLEIAPNVTRYLLGVKSDEQSWCTTEYVQDLTGEPDAQYGGGGGCGRGLDLPSGINVSRSFLAATGGRPAEHLISGSAPPGTARIVLSAPGVADLEVAASGAGPRWADLSYFLAAWPSATATTITALDEDGNKLAVATDKGMSPNGFDARYLEAYAVCLERGGVKVTRRPQGGGVGPAYEYGRGDLTPERMAELERACEAEGEAAAD